MCEKRDVEHYAQSFDSLYVYASVTRPNSAAEASIG
jgi:hypothetical protein